MDELSQHPRRLRSFHLFAGAGGGILGDLLLGHRVVGACEIEDYPREVLLQRQRDGILPRFPIWDDICTFDGKPWRGRVDIVAGGFPCQDISAAGKGAGIEGKRSGLWGQMARVIGEIRPRYVFVENSPLLVGRGLAVVLGDLAEMGYDARWCVLGADDVGGQHKRKRIWIVAYGDEGTVQSLGVEPSKNQKWREKKVGRKNWIDFLVGDDGDASPSWRCKGLQIDPRPIMRRDSDGVANGLDRIAAIGNGQVPQVAALAWEILTADLPD